MTQLPEQYRSISNVHLDAVEHGDDIIFMHSVKPGPANQSYGLQVARLAGVPAPAIALAKQQLRLLEADSRQAQGDLFAEPPVEDEAVFDPLRTELEALDPDSLTPREALDLLYRLRELCRD